MEPGRLAVPSVEEVPSLNGGSNLAPAAVRFDGQSAATVLQRIENDLDDIPPPASPDNEIELPDPEIEFPPLFPSSYNDGEMELDEDFDYNIPSSPDLPYPDPLSPSELELDDEPDGDEGPNEDILPPYTQINNIPPPYAQIPPYGQINDDILPPTYVEANDDIPRLFYFPNGELFVELELNDDSEDDLPRRPPASDNEPELDDDADADDEEDDEDDDECFATWAEARWTMWQEWRASEAARIAALYAEPDTSESEGGDVKGKGKAKEKGKNTTTGKRKRAKKATREESHDNEHQDQQVEGDAEEESEAGPSTWTRRKRRRP
ncbi:hypothetical protein DFH27DRAFT_616071 [Peziza echinospora]|nr:hypothetical protein DFH27DRAFT_616071 [Peziza echinospora]